MKIIYDLIIPITLITFICLIFTKQIRTNSKYFYAIAISIASLSTTYEIFKIITHGKKLTGIMYILERMSMKGFLALAFFLLVMFCGAMNSKWNITRKLMSIRGEMAILGSILMIPHIVIYTTKFIIRLTSSKPINAFTYIYIALGFIAVLLLIPLCITSFKSVRRKMNGAKWKSIQRWSYLFYLTTYLHIAIVLIAAKEFNYLKFTIYSVIFLGYTALRINKANCINLNSYKSLAE